MHITIAGHSAYTEKSSVYSRFVYCLVVHPRFSIHNRHSKAQRTFWLGFNTVGEAERFHRAINKIHKDERLRLPTFFQEETEYDEVSDQCSDQDKSQDSESESESESDSEEKEEKDLSDSE